MKLTKIGNTNDGIEKCPSCKYPLEEEWYFKNYSITILGSEWPSGAYQKYTGRLICNGCGNIYKK